MTNNTLEVPSPQVETVEKIPAPAKGRGRITLRAFALGLVLSVVLAGLNTWIEAKANVHFLGGVQMPFGAIVALLLLVLAIKGPLRFLSRERASGEPLMTPAELLTVYAMTLFATLISATGTDNFFITTGPALFYFTTPENRWASLFYEHIPANFAPGWNGQIYQREVIEKFYVGGLSWSEVPWHAWTAMLISWTILLSLVYGTLFFVSLLIRRQWIENEALTFPLVQLPLQMVELDRDATGKTGLESFWTNRTMWGGCALAFFFHFLRGMNDYFPDWPMISAFQGNLFTIEFTETPWNSAGGIYVEVLFGAIGIAYILTRELSFSFWVFFLLFRMQKVTATMFGFPVDTLPKDTYQGHPLFMTWQGVGGWLMMGLLLLWSARGHLETFCRAALNPRAHANYDNEPIAPRLVLLGLLLCIAGTLGWCWYAGINMLAAIAFFGLYFLVSIVLARMVVEGGFLFPQVTFAPIETLTGGFMGAAAIGAPSLAKMSFLQPMLFSDMRTNVLPGFLHTLKISHDLKLEKRDTRRLLLAVVCAILVTLGVSTFTSIATIYNVGGLSSYAWFTKVGPQWAFNGTSTMMRDMPGVQAGNWFWLSVGALLVWGMTFARSRFVWFPLHPLAFIAAGTAPITRMWFSFFVGWLVKTMLLRFGGPDAVSRTRPFMIGLILGNAAAMVCWMLFGMYWGQQISYWPA